MSPGHTSRRKTPAERAALKPKIQSDRGAPQRATADRELSLGHITTSIPNHPRMVEPAVRECFRTGIEINYLLPRSSLAPADEARPVDLDRVREPASFGESAPFSFRATRRVTVGSRETATTPRCKRCLKSDSTTILPGSRSHALAACTKVPMCSLLKPTNAVTSRVER